MTHGYEIPSATATRPRLALVYAGVGISLALAVARHIYYIDKWPHYRLITVIWTIAFAFTALQWVVSWLERPYTATPRQQAYLDGLRVTVSIPVYNEEPVVLDRVLYALFAQTRLPNRVDVVDDGSTQEDYSAVRDYWLAHHPPSVELTWHRYPNAGKKRAQARTFGSDPVADVFVTLDSDTTLAHNALEEGLKPFADPRVHSVAGIELAWNYSRSLLTRIKGVNALIWQFTVCSAQSIAGGNVLVNRGTYALYRGDMIRETLAAYIGETLFGRPVMLGDDTMLTLFALSRGRAVQQPSAVCFAMYPENPVPPDAAVDPVDARYGAAHAVAAALPVAGLLGVVVYRDHDVELPGVRLGPGRRGRGLASGRVVRWYGPVHQHGLDVAGGLADVRGPPQ